MLRENLPLTRTSYLNLAYGPHHPELDAETEGELPNPFRLPEYRD